jgi:hypothetical protein
MPSSTSPSSEKSSGQRLSPSAIARIRADGENFKNMLDSLMILELSDEVDVANLTFS